ncbi:MAG: HPr kinase/phosphatase C-terminal domain-containing protein [Pseudomonadota bacterium]
MAHLLHATAICIDAKGVLITGPSGAGKSDLALRLIEMGAVLIGDDAVVLEDGYLRAPSRLRGKIEARGVGIISVPHLAKPVALKLEVILGQAGDIARLPDYAAGQYACPAMSLNPFEASAPLKVRHAASQLSALVKAAS